MTGNYLTTEGRTLEKDLEMIDELGFEVRRK
jgi:biotin synthase-like enzyme